MELNKSYSVLILPQHGTQIKRLGISGKVVRTILYTGIAIASLSVWFLGDYFWTRSKKERKAASGFN